MALLGNLLTLQDEGKIVLWIIRIWLCSSTLVSSNRNQCSIFTALLSTGNYIQKSSLLWHCHTKFAASSI